MSNFSFSHNVFKSFLLLMHQNEYLWSKGLRGIYTVTNAMVKVKGIPGKMTNSSPHIAVSKLLNMSLLEVHFHFVLFQSSYLHL